MADKWDEKGKVEKLQPGEEPPTSSLWEAFKDEDERPVNAIVLRGYLGRSDFFKRTLDYLERARRIEAQKVKDEHVLSGSGVGSSPVEAAEKALADEGALDADAGAARDPKARIGVIDALMQTLLNHKDEAQEHVPLRLYLTPNLNRYVDFHRSSLLAYRREPRTERRDTFTVWLRVFEEGSKLPVPYRVVDETPIGPSFAGYLGGDLIDDYLGQPGSESTAWGDQSSVFGGRPGTGVKCGGRPGTGVRCGE